MKFEDDKYIHICQLIERELCSEYEANSALTDQGCLYALDRAKIQVKQAFGYGKNETAILDAELQRLASRLVFLALSQVNEKTGPTLRDFNARIEKISRSVRRHAQDGERSYYEFIKQFIR